MAKLNAQSLAEYHGTIDDFLNFYRVKVRNLEIDHKTLQDCHETQFYLPKIASLGINNLEIAKILNATKEKLMIEIEKQLNHNYGLVDQGQRYKAGEITEIDLGINKF